MSGWVPTRFSFPPVKDVAFATVLFIAGFLILLFAWRGTSRPEVLLVATPESITLGQVAIDSQVPFSVELSNQGAVPVDIMAIETGCTCTDAEMARYRIEPGTREVLNVKFKTGQEPRVFSTGVTVVFRGNRRSKLFTMDLPITARVE